jgi:hypothetical protein
MDEIICDVFTDVNCAQFENIISCAEAFDFSFGIMFAQPRNKH